MMSVANQPVGIVGGGPAGLATALALRAHGLDVCVIDQGDWSAARAGEHLAAAAQPTLERLGLQSLYERALLCRGIDAAWGAAEPQFQELQLFTPFGGGRIVERPGFDQAMLAHARAQGITCLERTRVHSATYTSSGEWRVVLRSGSTRTFSCLVDATGRAASLARAQGARVVVYDRLVGVSARMSGSHHDNLNKLHIWSARDGWWYLATLPGGERIATWMTDVEQIGQLGQRAAWQQHCARHFEAARLPPELASATWGRPRSFPAHSQRLQRPYGAGWIAVGDAALAFDPLSSQGLAKALRSGCDAADAIAQRQPEACARYQEKLEHDWQRYLDARCHYYRLEQRFPEAPFWRERQHEPALRQAIQLDPQRRLHRAPGACAASAAEVLARRVPEVDGAALFERLSGGERAHDIVRDLTVGQQLDDHVAIVALQLLLQHGVLLSAREG
jgi:flavin-dependent dehydrogenase